ncbi:MAG: protease pro-enzyme activation domain-containing protein [Candidatus Dormibacteria bacterium]
MNRRASLLFAGAAVAAATACGSSAAPATSNEQGASRLVTTAKHPDIGYAIAHGTDLGPLPPSTLLQLTLGLRGRDPQGLDALLASGKHVTPAEYARRFAPDAGVVGDAEHVLQQAGITARWEGGDTMSAHGSVAAVDALLAVRIDNRVGPDGVRFYAPQHDPPVPESLATAVNSVSGLTKYPRASAADIPSPKGISPSDALTFYDIDPLRSAGLDGTGITVAFVEIDEFDPAMLDRYRERFHISAPFNVQVATRTAGRPMTEQGEADLDLEIVHAIAPGAKEVVYYAAADQVPTAEAQMYHDFPNGAIESKSVGGCEAPGSQNANDAKTLGDLQRAASAKGWSIFVASGDRGAFDCAPDGDFNDVAADLDGGIPYITSVGGTLAFLATNSSYYKEAAWGEPIEQWGSGGGLSEYWAAPSWQQGPGVQNQYSNGSRETPDVSADADRQSGWDIFLQGGEHKVGGTSAAAPLWAACMALIDQDLTQKHLPLAGFANPALYTFAQNPAGIPVPGPYHDITTGTNLNYPATPGYDLATGLGSPDIGALTTDFEWYERNHAAG